jgi:alpha-L-fucosidase
MKKTRITKTPEKKACQRLSLASLQRWESLKYGMFIHFGMSTFEGKELPDGRTPSARYSPRGLDIDQWVSVARDAGMKYAVLTTKHVAGHCLWPSRHTDYHVGTSGNKTDVVDAFVKACEKRGVIPGLYYCSWDNHHKFGSFTPSDFMATYPGRTATDANHLGDIYSTRKYQDFQMAQLEELLTGYGKIGEVWIDIPAMLPAGFRQDMYQDIAKWQPESVIMMNNGIGDGSELRTSACWPTDLLAIERFLPNSHTGHVKWRQIGAKNYYLPGEVCDPIGKEWFYVDDDQPRSDAELLGMYLTTVSRGANLLLDVGPDRRGLIPKRFVDALMRLRKNVDKLGLRDSK